MIERERGAINAVWFVFVIVLFLGALGALYTQNQELTKVRASLKAAEAEAISRTEQVGKEIESHQKLSAQVGFKIEGARLSSQTAIPERIGKLREKYPNDITPADDNLGAILDRLEALADRYERVSTEADQNHKAELTARQASESTRDTSNRAVQEQLDQSNRDLADSRNLLTQQQQQSETRQADLQRQIDDATLQKNEAEAAHQKALATANDEISKASARNLELAEKQKIIGSDDNPWAVDGNVRSVSQQTGLVFLDIGSRDLLRAGVKFDVFRYGKGGELIPKGSIEVRETSTDYSRAGIISQRSRTDPIAPGDVVANPHFARNHTKVFVLLGNFPAYGREFLAQRLRDLGCEVQDQVTSHSDFLVLGEKGTEEGAPELTEDAGYKLAQSLGVQVMKLSDIERFIRP